MMQVRTKKLPAIITKYYLVSDEPRSENDETSKSLIINLKSKVIGS